MALLWAASVSLSLCIGQSATANLGYQPCFNRARTAFATGHAHKTNATICNYIEFCSRATRPSNSSGPSSFDMNYCYKFNKYRFLGSFAARSLAHPLST